MQYTIGMIILLTILALSMLTVDPVLLNTTAELSASLQNSCAQLSPQDFENRQWVSAVVCGKSPAQNSEYQSLQTSGLLHLIVVSGSHLVFLEQLLSILFRRWQWSFLVKIIVLGGFALITGFQPRVVRALCSHLLGRLQSSHKLFWSPSATTYIAGLIMLIIAPHWWQSLSLQLSWVAALSLQAVNPRASHFRVKQQLAIFLLMFPLLMQFAPPHPISIAYNLIAAPFVGLVLFPISALSLISAKVFWFVDELWNWFFAGLRFTLPEISQGEPFRIHSLSLNWIYIFSMNTILILKKQRE